MTESDLRCPLSCPKVKEHLRAEVAKNPWLLDEVFPQRKDDADSVHPPRDFVSKERDVRDKPKRVIEPVKAPEDQRIVQQVMIDFQKPTKDAPTKLESELRREVDFESERLVEKKEGVTDYDRFIEEELQRSRTVMKEPVGTFVPAVSCGETCPCSRKECIMRKLKERQRVVDHYYLTRGFNYFKDVCTCSLACILYTLSKDQFVRNIFASLALFVVGLKLCSELDAWEMPSPISYYK